MRTTRILRMLTSLTCAGMLSFSLSAFATDEISDDMRPWNWGSDLHLLTGIGINTSRAVTEDRGDVYLGLGSNFRTELLYGITKDIALEWGGAVKFHQTPDGLIWDSAFTLGLRAWLPPIFKRDESYAPYARLFFGEGPTVVFFKDRPPSPLDELGVQRLHVQANVLGFGVGHIVEGKSGRIFYVEFTGTASFFKRQFAIRPEGEVPVVVESGPANGTLYTIYFDIGLRAF